MLGKYQDKCATGKGKCENTPGSWKCICEPGYKNKAEDNQVCDSTFYCKKANDVVRKLRLQKKLQRRSSVELQRMLVRRTLLPALTYPSDTSANVWPASYTFLATTRSARIVTNARMEVTTAHSMDQNCAPTPTSTYFESFRKMHD